MLTLIPKVILEQMVTLREKSPPTFYLCKPTIYF